MPQITLTLSKEVHAALVRLASIVRRDPRDEAAILIRLALEDRDMLSHLNASHILMDTMIELEIRERKSLEAYNI